MGKLRVVHISDLHLFVEANGARRSQLELNKIVALGMKHRNWPLLGGFNVHEAKALSALRAKITHLCETSGVPVLVIQSGDVSTFGARMSAQATSLPEWDFWTTERTQPRRVQPVGWIDLYGNHDVWPGTLPIFGLSLVETARNELRRQHHPCQIPERRVIPVGTDHVEVYTLNTVQHSAVANTLAEGKIGFDHPDLTAPACYPNGDTEPLDYIAHLAHQHRPTSATTRVLRLLVMHHPPTFFGAKPGLSGAWTKMTSGPLANATELERWLERQEQLGIPQHLILAGHRHLVDPAPGQAPVPIKGTNTIQLVCGTPTQERTNGDPVQSFSVYDIDFRASVLVTRTLYERPATARDFKRSGPPLRII